MRYLSAIDDFRQRTLNQAGSGPLSRLCFLLGLREGTRFHHWGLERSHGAEAAVKALEECFYLELIDLTREKIARVFDEARPLDRKYFAALLDAISEAMESVPEEKRLPRYAHFNYVIEVLRAYLADLPISKPTS